MKKKTKKLAGIIATVVLLCISPGIKADMPVDLRVNGEFVTESEAYIENSVTYVPLRAVSEKLGFGVEWNDNEIIIAENKHIRNFILSDGTAYIAVRELGNLLGCDVLWDDELFIADISNAAYAADDSIYWLSRIIHAESEGECQDGKIAVGNVVLNRVESDEYPDTVYEVIFDNRYGVQFTPAGNGKIYNTPSKDSVKAAKYALRGSSKAGNSLFFLNEKTSVNKWIVNNRTFFTSIGNHSFYL